MKSEGETVSPLDEVRAISEDPTLRDTLFLIKQGIPFDVAFSLDDQMRYAWVVACGELDGGSFDWASGRWQKQNG